MEAFGKKAARRGARRAIPWQFRGRLRDEGGKRGSAGTAAAGRGGGLQGHGRPPGGVRVGCAAASALRRGVGKRLKLWVRGGGGDTHTDIKENKKNKPWGQKNKPSQ